VRVRVCVLIGDNRFLCMFICECMFIKGGWKGFREVGREGRGEGRKRGEKGEEGGRREEERGRRE
jgi:hypothetical protein